MKNILKFAFVALLATTTACASAIDLKGVLGAGKNGTSSSTTDAVSGILGAVSSLIGGSEIDLKSLQGDWQYVDPAITFESDNFLQKAGGAAASGVIVGKLRPYYKKANAEKLRVTFNADSTFTMNWGSIKTSGSVSNLGSGVYEFHFKAFGKVPTGKIKTYIQRQGADVCLTFDAKKLMELLKKVAAVSNNSTLQSVSSLLNSYQGMNIGVQLRKVGK